MDVFRVELDSPDGFLLPGQLVSGDVILRTKEAVKAKSIVVHVIGKAQTDWTVWETRTNQPGAAGVRHGHSQSVPYTAEEAYIDSQMEVWTSAEGDGQLSIGEHHFPFNFILPSHCPPSFEGTLGFIRYYCKAKILRPWKLDDTTKCSFTVMSNYDLNTAKYAVLPIAKDFCKIRIERGGYVPGESVEVFVDINSTKTISRVDISLVECSSYTASRPKRLLDVAAQYKHKEMERKKEQRTVAQHNDEFRVPSGTHRTYHVCLTIPPIVPSFDTCPIIQVDYKLKVKIIAKGALSNYAVTEVPIFIGTAHIRRAAEAQAMEQVSSTSISLHPLTPLVITMEEEHNHFTPTNTAAEEPSRIKSPPSYVEPAVEKVHDNNMQQ